VLETGLGGRLDSTNIIRPELSLITNISFDHTDLLGKDLASIAFEKAGIIKKEIPVIISESTPESIPVFLNKASLESSLIYQSDNEVFIENWEYSNDSGRRVIKANIRSNIHSYKIVSPLSGGYQLKNLKAVIKTCEVLKGQNWRISPEIIEIGIRKVIINTNLRGRWEQIGEMPDVFCDTGHNKAGIEEVIRQLDLHQFNRLHIVFGMMKDKATDELLSILPKNASYYFCAPDLVRALPAEQLQVVGDSFGLQGNAFNSVTEALRAAKLNASENDLIYVGGSTFVVAEVI
jgi:dihydrofolate synthase/folylpolyglutamate synthase